MVLCHFLLRLGYEEHNTRRIVRRGSRVSGNLGNRPLPHPYVRLFMPREDPNTKARIERDVLWVVMMRFGTRSWLRVAGYRMPAQRTFSLIQRYYKSQAPEHINIVLLQMGVSENRGP